MRQDEPDRTRPATLVEDWENLPGRSDQWVAGQRLGPFRLLKPLGQGGMGMVWLAEQIEPLRREVAIKVMLAARRTRLAEAYFEVERQALAQLSHRAIARIYDAGQLPDGGLFFAMEHVPGRTLDDDLAERRPSMHDLVKLLLEVCAGVQHAHQRGLIHRDLKPNNILVTTAEGAAQPKIIDFGIAIPSESSREANQTVYPRAGTRAYMAPEQRNPDASGIDVRADIYALGAVLAQAMLVVTGMRQPGEEAFDGRTVGRSLAISLGQAGAAQDDDLDPDESRSWRRLPRELRAIALKAMAPDREQRYPTAAAMADDLQRLIESRPVRAMPASRTYRLACFLRRNALASAAAGLIGLALVSGATAALYGLSEAREGRRQAEASRALAEQRRHDAERLIEFMLGDFAARLRPIGRLDLLDGIGSEAWRYLSAQTEEIDSNSALHRARALRTLGEVQVSRQQFELAEQTLLRAFELLVPWFEEASDGIAEVFFEAGQIAFWRGLTAYRQEQWVTTERHWHAYLDAAERFAEVSDDRRRARTELAYAYNNLGTLAESQNDLLAALTYFERTAEYWRALVEDGQRGSALDLANTLSWISRVQTALGRPADAWRSATAALDQLRDHARFEPEHAGRRRMEINLRYILGNQALYLDRSAVAAEHLGDAYRLALADVANDPTRPRRQAQLARIAFLLADLSAMHADRSVDFLDQGERAYRAAVELGLDEHQQAELPLRHWQARLSVAGARDDDLGQARAALAAAIDALESRQGFDAHFFALAEALTGLHERLRRAGQSLPAEWMARVRQRLDAVPERQTGSLRYLLLRLAAGGEERDQAALAARVAALRAQVVDLPDSG